MALRHVTERKSGGLLSGEKALGNEKQPAFSPVKPKEQVQKNHNKEAMLLLETKKSE
jgi:hypothetical protein